MISAVVFALCLFICKSAEQLGFSVSHGCHLGGKNVDLGPPSLTCLAGICVLFGISMLWSII